MAELGHLYRRMLDLRSRLERGFTPETAAEAFEGFGPSTGQCAATALVAHEVLGGELVSASVHDQSHWFNRVWFSNRWWDVDLTGDQFGYPSVQIVEADRLYSGSKLREASEVNGETLRRAVTLAERAKMNDIAKRLEQWLETTVGTSGG